jgi:hypothetical protein
MGELDQYWSAWRKSSYSGGNGGECVEVGAADDAVAVRDSKNPDGPKLLFSSHAWRQLTTRLKAGALDGAGEPQA